MTNNKAETKNKMPIIASVFDNFFGLYSRLYSSGVIMAHCSSIYVLCKDNH